MYDENGEHIPEDPWSSVVDLMSALVLVLFLAVIFFITNYSEVSEELAAEQVILQQRSADLEKTRQSLVSAQESNVDLIAKGKELSAETERLNAERDRAEAQMRKHCDILTIRREAGEGRCRLCRSISQKERAPKSVRSVIVKRPPLDEMWMVDEQTAP